MTADHQKMNPADRQTSRQIRSAIVKDKTLSTYSHNIKIITQNGKVTLKGPVRSDEEKVEYRSQGRRDSGADNVTNMLTVAPSEVTVSVSRRFIYEDENDQSKRRSTHGK